MAISHACTRCIFPINFFSPFNVSEPNEEGSQTCLRSSVLGDETWQLSIDLLITYHIGSPMMALSNLNAMV